MEVRKATGQYRAASGVNGLRLASAVISVILSACDGRPSDADSTAGDPERGRLLLHQYGCAACHAIPGVEAARGEVGPPLAGIAQRVYLAGVVPNTPTNMVRWIRAPREFAPLTAMPDMRVPEAEARHMVAYLYGLR